MNRTCLRRLLLPAAAIFVMALGSACTTPPPPPAGPVGSWRVTRYMNAGDGLSSPVAGSTITLTINANGQLGGRACNSYGASWSVNGAAIAIGNITSTVMACLSPEGVMQQEGDYFTALQAARTWRIEGDTLTLAHPRGTSVVAVRTT